MLAVSLIVAQSTVEVVFGGQPGMEDWSVKADDSSFALMLSGGMRGMSLCLFRSLYRHFAEVRNQELQSEHVSRTLRGREASLSQRNSCQAVWNDTALLDTTTVQIESASLTRSTATIPQVKRAQ
jgi:hypothetical protein